tara:strand:+ start:4547 stop:4981 length:435 start_codon:yes stop_codon:yes gene_type:complete
MNCTKFKSPNKKHIISYDFDNTLKNQYNGKPIYPIVKRMLEDRDKGKEIIICTARMEEHTNEIRNFLQKYNMENTPIIATNRAVKSPSLGKYAKDGYIVTHYDDQEGILADLVKNVPNIIAYKVLYEDVTPDTSYDDIVVRYQI